MIRIRIHKSLHLTASINDANNGSESEYNDGDAVAIYTKSSNNNASLISRRRRLRMKAVARRGWDRGQRAML
jgi:hypothetical protein